MKKETYFKLKELMWRKGSVTLDGHSPEVSIEKQWKAIGSLNLGEKMRNAGLTWSDVAEASGCDKETMRMMIKGPVPEKSIYAYVISKAIESTHNRQIIRKAVDKIGLAEFLSIAETKTGYGRCAIEKEVDVSYRIKEKGKYKRLEDLAELAKKIAGE